MRLANPRVIVLVAVALAVPACGDEDTTTVTETQASTVTQPPSDAPTQTAAEAGAATADFQTPSGNIACFMSAKFVNCVIVEATWQPPGDPSCPASAGRFASLEGGGAATIQCGMPSPPSGEVLAYGQRRVVGRYRCTSQERGVTCDTADGAHGIFLSRARGEAH